MLEEEIQDQKLRCVQCGGEFNWSAGEQRFYEREGLHRPKRCKICCESRKQNTIFGARTVMTDTVTRRVLCSRCSAPASRESSKRRHRALCPKCAGEGGSAAAEDIMSIEEWIAFAGPLMIS